MPGTGGGRGPIYFRYPPGPEPPLLPALRTWLGGWPGIGRIVAGMMRQGFDLQLARHGADGWRASGADAMGTGL